MLFIYYPKCSTCIKAKKFLDENNIAYLPRDIVNENPSFDELKKWYLQSGLELKKFFNTNGKVYKDLDLKNKLDILSDDEKLKLLASNGMLVKRPILVDDKFILVGFQANKWLEKIK